MALGSISQALPQDHMLENMVPLYRQDITYVIKIWKFLGYSFNNFNLPKLHLTIQYQNLHDLMILRNDDQFSF